MNDAWKLRRRKEGRHAQKNEAREKAGDGTRRVIAAPAISARIAKPIIFNIGALFITSLEIMLAHLCSIKQLISPMSQRIVPRRAVYGVGLRCCSMTPSDRNFGDLPLRHHRRHDERMAASSERLSSSGGEQRSSSVRRRIANAEIDRR